jgi:hypothetical protein
LLSASVTRLAGGNPANISAIQHNAGQDIL